MVGFVCLNRPPVLADCASFQTDSSKFCSDFELTSVGDDIQFEFVNFCKSLCSGFESAINVGDILFESSSLKGSIWLVSTSLEILSSLRGASSWNALALLGGPILNVSTDIQPDA